MVKSLTNRTSVMLAGLLAVAGCSIQNGDVKVEEKPKFYTSYLEEFCDKAKTDDSYKNVGILVKYLSQFSVAYEYMKNNVAEGCEEVSIVVDPDLKLKLGDIYKGKRMIPYNPLIPPNQVPEEKEEVPEIKFRFT